MGGGWAWGGGGKSLFEVGGVGGRQALEKVERRREEALGREVVECVECSLGRNSGPDRWRSLGLGNDAFSMWKERTGLPFWLHPNHRPQSGARTWRSAEHSPRLSWDLSVLGLFPGLGLRVGQLFVN